MAVYSNTDILQAIKDETIICLPFNKQHVSEASLDFTLGYYYYRQEANSEPGHRPRHQSRCRPMLKYYS